MAKFTGLAQKASPVLFLSNDSFPYRQKRK